MTNIKNFQLVIAPNGSMMSFGLGGDGKMYQYDFKSEVWETIATMETRRKITDTNSRCVDNLLRSA